MKNKSRLTDVDDLFAKDLQKPEFEKEVQLEMKRLEEELHFKLQNKRNRF